MSFCKPDVIKLSIFDNSVRRAGIVREREDRYELKSPTLFIFGEKDEVIPLDQVSGLPTFIALLKNPMVDCISTELKLASICPLQVSALEAKLEENCKADYQVKIFPGQTHGFVHRKSEDINPADKPCIQEARTDMLNWLNKYV